MKSKIPGMLLIALLAGPMAAEGVPVTGTYDVTFSGPISGTGVFQFDATTGLVSNFLVAVGIFNGSLDFSMQGPLTHACFVEWSLSPGGTPCESYPRLGGFGTGGGTAQTINYAFRRDNTWGMLDYLGVTRYDDYGIYSASLRSVPEPGTFALLGLGLLGLGVTRRRAA